MRNFVHEHNLCFRTTLLINLLTGSRNNSASSQRPEIVHRLFLWMISFAFVLALQVLFSAAVFAADQQGGGG